MKYYTASELAKKYNISYDRALARFHSPFAKERWGISILQMPDGKKKIYIPESSLHLWERTKKWARPTGRRWGQNNTKLHREKMRAGK